MQKNKEQLEKEIAARAEKEQILRPMAPLDASNWGHSHTLNDFREAMKAFEEKEKLMLELAYLD